MKPSSPTPAWPEAVDVLAPLGAWFEGSRRELPWRAKDLDFRHPDPYAVLVSEVMLQQTQVATVLPYFERWMRTFPDVASVAAASGDSVHKQWEGLGYYRRARHLQAAARALAEQGWPTDLQGLLRLPGLGLYTAAAVASIAFQWPDPALDGNALRVAARLLAIEDPRAHQPALRNWLRPALRRFGASRMTQGIMELGALICLPRNPRCSECPLLKVCAAESQGLLERCPGTRERSAPKEFDIWLVALCSGDRWLVEQPQGRGLLAGLWRWPALTLSPAESSTAEATVPFGIEAAQVLKGWVQTYSHRREHVTPCRIQLDQPIAAGPGREWVQADALQSLPMGRRDQRLRRLTQGPVPKPPRAALGVPGGGPQGRGGEPAVTALPLGQILAALKS